MNPNLPPIDNSSLEAQPEPVRSRQPGSPGERRVVTILFCDVTGSTAMAGQLDPEEWAELMDEAFGYLTAPVHRYEGTVARLMGDAILAFFGAPLAHEDDPERAILAGLDIIAGLQPFGEQVRRETGLDFNVRVGINTGPVVVGDIGSQVRMEYTAMGDAVNLAARMQAAADPGTVQISESTYRLVAPLFDCQSLGEIQVKGKNEPVPAYRVLGRKAQPGRLRGIPGLHSPLIGREREMDALREALNGLRQGRPGIIALIGEAGLGKSRLLEELRRETTDDGRQTIEETKDEGRRTNEKIDNERRVTEESNALSSIVDHPSSITWLESHGVSYDTQRPYGLFRQQVRQTCGVSPVDPPEVARQKIVASMVNAPFAKSSDFERIRRTTEVLLSVESDPDSAQVSGEAFKRELYEVILTVYRSLAMRGPLVMVCDDLHWADPASVDLLLHLFQLVDSYPILFLCAFRPYRRTPGWNVKLHAETQFPHLYREFLLSPLSDADSDALISSLLAVSNLPEGLRNLMMEKAEGNPFFVEEVIRTLIERGAIEKDASGLRWQATGEVRDLSIPDTLQGLLIARIDRLEAEVRRTLQLAAVIGRRFPYRLLQEVAAIDGALDRHLGALQRAELVQEAGRVPELEFAFHHELTRDAAYETILHRQRRQFHLRVGEALEREYAGRLEPVAHRLAEHFREGRDLERALKYYQLAGEAAARLYANQEAAVFYGQAIEIARNQAPETELAFLYARRGRVLELCGEYERALENYRELETLAKERGSLPLELAAVIPQATIFSTPTVKQDAQLGSELSLHSLGLARELKDYRAEAKALWNLMLIVSFTNRDPQEGIAYGETALAIAREHNLREELAYTLHDLFRLYGLDGQEEPARAALEEAQVLWRELGNLPMLADSYSTAAEDLMLKGQFDQAVEYGLEAQRISRSINSTWGEAYSLYMLGPAYMERGEFSTAITAIQTSIDLAKEANFWAPLVAGPAFLSFLYDFLGQPETSREWIQRLITEVEKVTVIQPTLPVWRAYLHLMEGDAAGAIQILKEMAGQVWFESSEIFFGPLATLIIGRILLANGGFEEVLQMTGQVLDEMPGARFPVSLPDLLELQGRALLGLGQLEAAERKMVQALEEARRIGARWRQPFLLATLASLAGSRGEKDLADARRSDGREQVLYLESQIYSPELRESFLALPDIKALLR